MKILRLLSTTPLLAAILVAGPAPAGFDFRYVPRLVADGSGRRLRIAGQAILQVGLHLTRTDVASPARARRAFGLPNAITAVRSGMFEGWTTYGIGLVKADQGRGHQAARPDVTCPRGLTRHRGA